MSKRILITGLDGYIGNELEAHLALFETSYVLDRVSVRDRAWIDQSWQDYDSIVHLAAAVHNPRMSIERLRDINVRLTKDVANKAKMEGVKQIVFMSSFSVYGLEKDNKNRSVVTKKTPEHPRTEYGKSKLEAEKVLREMQTEAFKVAIVRAPLVYGPFCTKGNYPKFLKLANITPIFPNTQNARSIIYSRNLAELIRLIVDNELEGLFLPQNPEYANTSEFIFELGKMQGKRIILIDSLRVPTRILAAHISVFGKLFGSAHYLMDDSDCELGYQLFGMKESIHEIAVLENRV